MGGGAFVAQIAWLGASSRVSQLLRLFARMQTLRSKSKPLSVAIERAYAPKSKRVHFARRVPFSCAASRFSPPSLFAPAPHTYTPAIDRTIIWQLERSRCMPVKDQQASRVASGFSDAVATRRARPRRFSSAATRSLDARDQKGDLRLAHVRRPRGHCAHRHRVGGGIVHCVAVQLGIGLWRPHCDSLRRVASEGGAGFAHRGLAA